MNCPNCSGNVVAWPWEDGGYKGIQCDSCGQQWWSDAAASKLYEVEKKAVIAFLAVAHFPADAQTDEDWRKQLNNTRRGEEPKPCP